MSFAIGYFRVSTDKQGASGLGLGAQREAVERFCAVNGLTMINSFQDVESGRLDDREGLTKAIALSKQTGATIIVAKLDRISRDVHFVSGLIKSGVQFCDTETGIQENPFMTLVRSCFSMEEARLCGVRTKEALRQAKLKGVKLGSHIPSVKEAARQGRLRKGKATVAKYTPIFMELLAQDITTAHALATMLNARGILSPSGKAWTRPRAHEMKKRVLASVENG